MTDAKQQADEIWRIGNRYGADADRKRDIAESLEAFAASIHAEATRAEREACLADVRNELYPRNERSDWTKYAEQCASAYERIAAAIRARSATQGEGRDPCAYPACDCGKLDPKLCAGRAAAPQPPPSPSQEGGLRDALEDIAKYADMWCKVAGQEAFGDIALRARAALAHDGGKGKVR